MSNDALILELAAGLTSVRRRIMTRELLWLLAVAAAEAALIVAMGAVRPDMGRMIGSAYMTWKVGSLALLAGITGAVAIRSFSPPASPRRGLALALVLAGVAMIVGTLMALPFDSGRSVVERLAPMQGALCAASIVVLALPLLAMLGFAMRRAAPVYPQASALATGLAAGTGGALVFTLCCPMNDPLYITIWYGAGCAAVAGLSRWLLPRHFRL